MVKNTSYIKLKQIQNDLKRNYLKTAALVLLIFMVSKKKREKCCTVIYTLNKIKKVYF